MPTQKLNYYLVSVYRCTVHVYGRLLQLSCITFKLLLITYFVKYGPFLGVATQVFYTNLYSVVVLRSNKLSFMACNSPLFCDIFSECKTLAYTSVGYNSMYGHHHVKSYMEQERLCSSFIRILRLFPELNRTLLCEVEHICTA